MPDNTGIYIDIDPVVAKMKIAFQELTEQQLNTATARALNRTIAKGRTIVKKETNAVYKFKAEDAKGLKIFRANRNQLEARIMTSPTPISLTHFNPRFIVSGADGRNRTLSIVRRKNKSTGRIDTIRKTAFKRGKVTNGVSFEIKKGQRKTLPYAFMIKGDTAAKPVFARGQYKSGGFGFIQRHKRLSPSGNDLPISKLITVSYHGATVNPDVQENTSRDLTPQFEQRMEHEINWILQKAANT